MGKVNIFYGPQINTEGKFIRWDNRTCLISAISQIWIGKVNEGKWGMTKGTGSEGLNLELNSGSIHSLISEDHEFLVKAYDFLCEIAEEGISREKYILDFKNNSLQLYEEPEETPEEIPAAEPAPAVYTGIRPIRQELNRLMEHCSQKDNMGTAVQQLLEDIAACYDGTGQKEVKELYKLFIQLSLINDCNELGLNTLIEEIKNSVYH